MTTSFPKVYAAEKQHFSRQLIDRDCVKIMQRLNHQGFKGYLVGGGVRDILLGKTPKDFDVATDATPKIVKRLFRNSRIIGRRFQLVQVYFGRDKIIQVSTFRDVADQFESANEEGDGKSYKPQADNNFGTESSDAFRRDLTINGLFYDIASNSILDYVGGFEDLKSGVIRIIGDPETRFREDPVRMLRTVRHAARTGFRIEERALAAIKELKYLIKDCPAMRIYEEVKKDLTSGSCLNIFRGLEKAELLSLFLPEIANDNSSLLENKSYFSRILHAADELFSSYDVNYKTNNSKATATSLFALIALFAASDGSNSNPINNFKSEDNLRTHLSKCFTKLSITRNEKERVAILLKYWHLLSVAPQKLSRRSLARVSLADDLLFFCQIMYLVTGNRSQLDLTSQFLKKR
jgi:poly(A) polymerase